MDERGFFDNLAPHWDDNEVLSVPSKVREILSFTSIKKGDSVLDLGTGTGVLLPFIAGTVGPEGKIMAVDYSAGMLKRAMDKYSGLEPAPEFLNIDFETETIEGEFDVILLYCVYPHLHTPLDTLKWLRAVNLKPGGEIIIAFPCGPEFINNIHRERHSESDILPTAPALCSMLREGGMDAEVRAATPDAYVVAVKK